VIFDIIVFPLAAFVLFRGLSHKNAWLNHTIPSEENSVWILRWTTLLGIFCKKKFYAGCCVLLSGTRP